jgi:hypothetical protein
MSYRHPAAIAHDLQRWMRPDAYRFIRPDWRRFVTPGSELAAIYQRYEAKYRPDQARVPAGVREGGQWTTEEGGSTGNNARNPNGGDSASKPSGRATHGTVLSDAAPDAIRPGAHYAALTEIEPEAITGDQRIDSTTATLTPILGHAADVADAIPGLTPQEYGQKVHEIFADVVRVLGLPGIGYDDVETTFGGAYYGAKGSVRTDVIVRDDAGKIIAIYDVKTGSADMSAARAAELRMKVGVDNSAPILILKTFKVYRKMYNSASGHLRRRLSSR